jgi:hypothetical protein
LRDVFVNVIETSNLHAKQNCIRAGNVVYNLNSVIVLSSGSILLDSSGKFTMPRKCQSSAKDISRLSIYLKIVYLFDNVFLSSFLASSLSPCIFTRCDVVGT